MARQSTFPVYDRALNGHLSVLLRRWADEGLPLSEMAYRLRIDHDVKVSISTVGRWVRSLEDFDKAAS